MKADGLATAAFVMGPEDGKRFIEQAEGAEALFLVREPAGTFSQITTSGFMEKTGYDPAR